MLEKRITAPSPRGSLPSARAAAIALVATLAAFAQPSASGAAPTRPPVDEKRLRQHIEVLASDAFEGRAPGTPGEAKTVAYLINQFKQAGLQPGGTGGSWTQDVPIVGIKTTVTGSFNNTGQSSPLTYPQDFVAWSPRLTPTTTVTDSEVVFVGYGVTAPEYGWDDYRGIDVRGKTVVMLVNDPQIPDPQNPDQLDEHMFKGNAMTYYGRWTYKFEEAGRRGAAAALVIHETKPAAYPWFVVVNSWGRERFDLTGNSSPRVDIAGWLSLERAQKLFADNGTTYEAAKAAANRRDFRALPLKEKASFAAQSTQRSVRSKNVLAKLPGASRPLRDEWLIYTAHWDHLGRDPKLTGDQIFNGALDNAAGTAGLLELARVFRATTPRPPRTVLFLAVTAEEQGLLGSAYYAAHPVHPLTRTVANINMDGLNQWGRTRDVEIVGAGNSSLEDVLTRAAADQGRVTKPGSHPERGSFYRSDHFEFMKLGLPALYAKSGLDYRDHPAGYGENRVTEYIDRDYHKVSDEIKPDWDLSGAVEDLELLRTVGIEVGTAPQWPTWREGSEFKAIRDQSMSAAPSASPRSRRTP